jgi:hypothetical protein
MLSIIIGIFLLVVNFTWPPKRIETKIIITNKIENFTFDKPVKIEIIEKVYPFYIIQDRGISYKVLVK